MTDRAAGDEGGAGPQELCTGPLAELILDMTCGVTRLVVLLGEADEEEWPHVEGRLRVLQGLVQQLPTRPRSRRKIGFAAKRRKR